MPAPVVTNAEVERICYHCDRKFDHDNKGCSAFRDRALACRLGKCRVRDRTYWNQLAEREARN